MLVAKMELGLLLQFYMWEPSPECMVRSLALVAIALDWSLPVRQRAHMFLEVFGNIKVRDKTARYLETVRNAIISLVCDKEGRLSDAVDPSALTYRDIDDIHDCAKRLAYGVDFDGEGGLVFWHSAVLPAAPHQS
jgi:hypothetical protein